MRELSLEQMNEVDGGSCGSAVAAGVVNIFGLAAALSATGVGAVFGVGLAVAAIAIQAYDVATEGDPCG